jgi:hypothetical protein
MITPGVLVGACLVCCAAPVLSVLGRVAVLSSSATGTACVQLGDALSPPRRVIGAGAPRMRCRRRTIEGTHGDLDGGYTSGESRSFRFDQASFDQT